MEKQMVENSNTVAMNAHLNACLVATLLSLDLSINNMEAIVKELQDQNKVYEARICSAFTWYMVGVHSLALEVRACIGYQDKVSLVKIDNINHVCNQINRCSAMRKEYSLHSEQGITVDEQILQKLETLKNLVKAEQLDLTAIVDIAVELIRATLQAYNQLLCELKVQVLRF